MLAWQLEGMGVKIPSSLSESGGCLSMPQKGPEDVSKCRLVHKRASMARLFLLELLSNGLGEERASFSAQRLAPSRMFSQMVYIRLLENVFQINQEPEQTNVVPGALAGNPQQQIISEESATEKTTSFLWISICLQSPSNNFICLRSECRGRQKVFIKGGSLKRSTEWGKKAGYAGMEGREQRSSWSNLNEK